MVTTIGQSESESERESESESKSERGREGLAGNSIDEREKRRSYFLAGDRLVLKQLRQPKAMLVREGGSG